MLAVSGLLVISDAVGTVDFPTLGDLVDGWIEQHCLIPDGFQRGKPFVQYDWQFWCTANHYRIREDVKFDPERPPMNQAFTYRRSQVVAPQKVGKGPWAACLTANEAVGPALFAGWARRGDAYQCEDHGCPCGWYFAYEPGEPMGTRHPSPLIQLTANSQDQVDNTWRPLTAMIRKPGSRLGKLLLPREDFIRVVGENDDDPELDRIDMVTSSARSRVGNPISSFLHDESGFYTKQNKMWDVADAQRRGAAGMGGRGVETTNCWDPSTESVAQSTYETHSADVFRFWRNPDTNPRLRGHDGKPLSYGTKVNRRRIHAYVYEGSDHVNLDSIEAEAAELVARDPAQAERFFGNRVVAGGGSWLPDGLWEGRRADVVATA
ncbi:terminase [Auraticoccus monumenti]|uniref:Terminase n=1 Tax=Auraticoccus monumenti TaxID=675864 RepID=A0A1G6UJE8_9ACTN|nr:terminase [Auraticoccus monumenti]SDD41528.1 hypothetical protein SAMN04489747_0902 [Auraticoccus monumenti]